MRALPLVLTLLLIGCAHKQVRDDAPGSGGGIGLDVARQTAVSMAMGGLGTPGLQTSNGGPNEHSSQDMTAKSITLSAATGANAVGVTTNGARIDFGAGASDHGSSDGTTVTFAGPIAVGGGSGGVHAMYVSSNSTAQIGLEVSSAISQTADLIRGTQGGVGTTFVVKPDGTISSTSTKTRGTITLSAGSGTATVTSGAICTCVDTTANASVRCAVSTTTLTATGTASDVIAYLCL